MSVFQIFISYTFCGAHVTGWNVSIQLIDGSEVELICSDDPEKIIETLRTKYGFVPAYIEESKTDGTAGTYKHILPQKQPLIIRKDR